MAAGLLVCLLILPTAYATQPPAEFDASPPSFEPNYGQADPELAFVARVAHYVVGLRRSGSAMYCPRGTNDRALRLEWMGGAANPEVTHGIPLPSIKNYYQGSDPARWHTQVPQFQKVGYQNLYPGIDLEYSIAGGSLEYSFAAKPGADPSRVRMRSLQVGALF